MELNYGSFISPMIPKSERELFSSQSIHSKFSIGIWNNLKVRYTAKRVYALVQSNIKHLSVQTNSFQPTNSQLPSHPYPPKVPNHSGSSSFWPHNTLIWEMYLLWHQKSSVLKLPSILQHQRDPCHYSGKAHLVPNLTSWESTIVTHRTASPVVINHPHVAAANIGAHSAAWNLIKFNTAMLSNNLLIINTPFIPNKWERWLRNTTSFNVFSGCT